MWGMGETGGKRWMGQPPGTDSEKKGGGVKRPHRL